MLQKVARSQQASGSRARRGRSLAIASEPSSGDQEHGRHSEVLCAKCPVGVASSAGSGHFCPFVDRSRQSGELIFLEGEPANHVWFVKQGTIVLLRKGGENNAEGRVRAVRFPGSFIGLETLVSDRYIDSARATTDAILCGTTRAGVDAWLGTKGSPARTALELTLRAECVDLPRRAPPDGNAVERVAAWLCDEGPRGVTLTLPRRIVADLLGMRPETLSRAMAILAERGAIEVTRTKLRIVNPGVLAELAGGEPGGAPASAGAV